MTVQSKLRDVRSKDKLVDQVSRGRCDSPFLLYRYHKLRVETLCNIWQKGRFCMVNDSSSNTHFEFEVGIHKNSDLSQLLFIFLLKALLFKFRTICPSEPFYDYYYFVPISESLKKQ